MLLRLLFPALLALALAVAGCSDSDAPSGSPLEGRVTRVVDGDTVHVRLAADGRRETVRYIGIDTPETARSPRGRQCFGDEATAANERLAAGEQVVLELDREHRDRFGRLLAYVVRSRDGSDLNAELLRGGWARPLVVAPNVGRRDRYQRLADQAKRERRGLWAICPSDR